MVPLASKQVYSIPFFIKTVGKDQLYVKDIMRIAADNLLSSCSRIIYFSYISKLIEESFPQPLLISVSGVEVLRGPTN